MSIMYVDTPPSAIETPHKAARTNVVGPTVNANRSYSVLLEGLSSHNNSEVSPEYQLLLVLTTADDAERVSGSPPS